MSDTEERIKQALDRHQTLLQSFVDKGKLTLTIQCDSLEAADELVEWMYNPKQTQMKAELHKIAANELYINKNASAQEKIEHIKALLEGE